MPGYTGSIGGRVADVLIVGSGLAPPALRRPASTRLSMTWPSSAMPALIPVWTALVIREERADRPASGDIPLAVVEVVIVEVVEVAIARLFLSNFLLEYPLESEA